MTNNLSAGTRVKALDFPRAFQVFNATTISNISTTTYVKGTPEIAVRFVAPSSGRVAVHVGAGTSNDGANNDRIFIAFQILEGDPANGTVFQSAESKRGVSNPATQVDRDQFHGHTTMVNGLTPGTYYYAQMLHRVTLGSATADIAHRHLMVWPIP